MMVRANRPDKTDKDEWRKNRITRLNTARVQSRETKKRLDTTLWAPVSSL